MESSETEYPNPVRAQTILTIDAVDSVRRMDCRSYDGCLSIASRANWPGFYCGECGAYAPLTREEQVKQGLRIMRSDAMREEEVRRGEED